MRYEIWQAPAGEGAFANDYHALNPWVKVWEDELLAGDSEAVQDGRLTPQEVCEAIFAEFQRVSDDPADYHMPPATYTGRSLTTGDLIRLGDDWYFCCVIGFARVSAPVGRGTGGTDGEDG